VWLTNFTNVERKKQRKCLSPRTLVEKKTNGGVA
jgi:hypothetical protein